MSFHIVEFQDGLHVIPFSWLSDDNKQAYWPPYKDTLRLCKAVINMESPVEDDWDLLDVLKDIGSADNYPDATAKLKLMEDASDLDNFDDGEAFKKSRARRHRILPISPDRADDDGQTTEPELEDANRRTKKATGGHGKEQTSMPKKPANFITVRKGLTITNVQQLVTQNLPHTNVKPRTAAGGKAAKTNGTQHPMRDKTTKENDVQYRPGDETVNGGQDPSVDPIEEHAPKNAKPQTATGGKAAKTNGTQYPIRDQTTKESNIQDRPGDETVNGVENLSVDSIQEHAVNKGVPELPVLGETYQELLRIVNKICTSVDEVNKRLKSIELSLNAKPPQAQADKDEAIQDELEAIFPLGSLLEFDEFEKKLREKEFASRVIHFMRTIGGTNVHDFVFNVSKRCLTNSLAMQYSMDGKKKKIPLKPMAFMKTFMKAAKLHKSNPSEDEIKKSVSAWFVGAKLRFTRETAKEVVGLQNVEDVPDV